MTKNSICATFLYSTAIALCLNASQANAQAQRDGASSLPPVTVDAPRARRAPAPVVRRAAAPVVRRAPAPVVRRAAAPARRVVSRPVVARNAPVVAVENPRGPIQGYVATRSLSGTKTNTPIIETPQSLSVIGADQLRDQKINGKFDEALRYTPGVVGGTFGPDFRNDWFLIRGFKSDDNSLFLDGLQLFYTSYASWKLQPFNLDRIEVLRGPSAIL